MIEDKGNKIFAICLTIIFISLGIILTINIIDDLTCFKQRQDFSKNNDYITCVPSKGIIKCSEINSDRTIIEIYFNHNEVCHLYSGGKT